MSQEIIPQATTDEQRVREFFEARAKWPKCPCGNPIHPQEYRAGFRTCEHCDAAKEGGRE